MKTNKKTIEEILAEFKPGGKHEDDTIERIELDYEGDVETFDSEFEMPLDAIGDEEATSTFKNGTLKIKVS